MRIRAGYEIAYDCPQPTPMLLVLSVHPSRLQDLEGPHRIAFDPPLEAQDYHDGFGNICTRIVAPEGRLTISTDFTRSRIPACRTWWYPTRGSTRSRNCPTRRSSSSRQPLPGDRPAF